MFAEDGDWSAAAAEGGTSHVEATPAPAKGRSASRRKQKRPKKVSVAAKQPEAESDFAEAATPANVKPKKKKANKSFAVRTPGTRKSVRVAEANNTVTGACPLRLLCCCYIYYWSMCQREPAHAARVHCTCSPNAAPFLTACSASPPCFLSPSIDFKAVRKAMKSSPLVPSKALPQPEGILKQQSAEEAARTAAAAAAAKKKAARAAARNAKKGSKKRGGKKKRKSASDFFLNVTGTR